MNAQELAQKMLDWEVKRQELDTLEDELRVAVLELGKTQTVGNVRVSYSAGRKSFDYMAGVKSSKDMNGDVLDTYTEHRVVEKVDWRGICKHLDVKDIPFTQSKPSASVKMLS